MGFKNKQDTTFLYGSTRGIFISVLFLFGGIYFIFFEKTQTVLMWSIFIFGILIFLFSVAIKFYPIIEFDKETICAKTFRRRQKIYWSEIEGVIRPSFSYAVILMPKKGYPIILSPLVVEDYFLILKEIISHIKKNNPEAIIDKNALKWAKKPPRYFAF